MSPKRKTPLVDKQECALYIITSTPERLTSVAATARYCAAMRPPVPVRVFSRESSDYKNLLLIARHRVLTREAILLVLDGAVRARFSTASDEVLALVVAHLPEVLRASGRTGEVAIG